MNNLPVKDYQNYLDELLTEKLPTAASQEREAFDRSAGISEGQLIIYGAGGLGLRILEGLQANGVEPIAFIDRSPIAQTRRPGGLEVLPPEVAARRFGNSAVIVVAVWNPLAPGGVRSIIEQLISLGCRRVVPFTQVFWKYPETFLPYYLCDLPSRILPQADQVRLAYALFDEPESQLEFLRQLEMRLTGDLASLPAPTNDPQYFSGHLFRPLNAEYFVDCGAYDGDTLLGLAEWTGGAFQHAVAFEADPGNFAQLERRIAADPRLRGRARAVSAAVGLTRGRLRFAASGMANAGLSEEGNIDVDCVPLDEVLEAETPTYIKMDIEGAEMDALAGAAAVIAKTSPLLAICSYHTQNHLWEIPLRIRELLPECRLFLRMHCVDGFDLVCYAIPPWRQQP
jgi:FkbM family methyltransferase